MPAQNELHPVLQYLKDNVVVIGILAVLAVSIGIFGVSQASTGTAQTSEQPAAPEVSAVPLEAPSSVQPQTPSAPAETPAPSAAVNPARSDSPVVGQAPAGAATASPEIVAGGAQQAVTAQAWRPVAEAFAAAWANPDGGKDAWASRLQGYATPALTATFAYTDIRNVPADELVSVSTIDEASGTVSFSAVYAEGGTRFQGLAIIRSDGSWLVDKVAAPEKK